MDRRKNIMDTDERFMVDLYRKNKAYMLHIARKFTDSQSACEEAIQSAMVRLLRNADSLRQLSENQLSMYLFLTIRSVLAHREMPEAVPEMPEAEAEPEDDILHAAWDTAMLKEQLPPREWRLLELTYIAGYTDQEIARELRCVPGSVRTLLRRAQKRAKAILSNQNTHESEG